MVSNNNQQFTSSAKTVSVSSPIVPEGFNLPIIEFENEDGSSSLEVPSAPPIISSLASAPAITAAEMVELSGGTGKLLYYPLQVSINPGDVFYLRERNQGENGIIVQIVTKETASYAQVDSKVLWRLLTKVKAQELQRAHHEPAEVIDLFLSATFKIRAAIIDSKWASASGNIVTRNVDIFPINPKILTDNILNSRPRVNINLGDFKGQQITFSGQSFDKINLVTGMKGAGKSHITKGIIDEARKRGMSAVVFDINDEYGQLPEAIVFKPGTDLKFRLDRVRPRSFVEVIQKLAPFSDRTSYPAIASIPKIFGQRMTNEKKLDITVLKDQANIIFPGREPYINNMRNSYIQSLETVEAFDLFMTSEEIVREEKFNESRMANSLSSAFYNLDQQHKAGVVVFSIGGLLPVVQRIIVKLALDGLKEICDRQTTESKKKQNHIPIYPTVFFEEAHMYMDERDINELIPLIRHLGMNLFFITNTPGDLPDSVFRLLDNLIMTRMLNEADIRRVGACGLTDRETIEGFAPELPEHHALLLSAKDGITKTFPLVFNVRDFGLPASGVTRSMWHKLDAALPSPENNDSEKPTIAPEIQDDMNNVSAEPVIDSNDKKTPYMEPIHLEQSEEASKVDASTNWYDSLPDWDELEDI